MTDLHQRLARLDEVQAPDLWPEIAARSPDRSTALGPVSVAWRGTTRQMRVEPKRAQRAGRTRHVLWAAALLVLAMAAAAAIYVGTRPALLIVTNGPIILARTGDLVSVHPVSGTLARAGALLGCERDCPEITSVAWSPDGTRLAYASDGFLWIRNMEIGDTRRIAACCTTDEAFAPGPEPMALDWSPDGSSVAFTLDGALWVAGSDGSDVRRVVAVENGGARTPSWLPVGRKIGFSLVEGERHSIAVHDLDSGVTTTVVTGEGPFWAPTWSPDGTRIVYFTGGMPERLVSVRADGSDPITLLEVPGCCTITIPAADWSPDGKLLAVVIHDLLLVQPDGSGFRRLAQRVGADRPAWRPLLLPADQQFAAVDTPGAGAPEVRPPATAVPVALLSTNIEMRSLDAADLDTGRVVALDDAGADLQLSPSAKRVLSRPDERSLAHVLVAGGAGPGARPLGPDGCLEALEEPDDIGIVLLGASAVSLQALTPQSHLCALTDEGNIAEFWPVDPSALDGRSLTIHVEVWALP